MVELTQSTVSKSRTSSGLDNRFDWTTQEWEHAIDGFKGLIRDVSTGWQKRRCTPQANAQDVRQLFTESLPQEGRSLDTLIAKLRTIGEYSGYNGHPRWLAYITSSPDPVGVMASFFTAAINQNNFLWRMTPAAASIELQCLNWFKEMFGLSAEWEGTFTSGGQFANIIACAAARTAKCPWDVRRYGVAGPQGSGRMRIYTSDQAHYCHNQAVELLGLGSEALQFVPADAEYRMRLDRLAEMVARDRQQGHIPIAVIATAGTVGVGGIDPLAELRTWTEQENLWLHIDGSYGLPAFLVPEVAPKLMAIQQADSLSFDPAILSLALAIETHDVW